MINVGYRFPKGNQINKNRSPWNKGKSTIFPPKFCERCGILFKKPNYRGKKEWGKQRFCSKSCVHKGNKTNLGRKHSIETRKKMSESHPKGELSHLWKQDRSDIIANKSRWGDFGYRLWRDQIFKRDGYKCKMGNNDCVTYIEAHHILSWGEYPELRYQLTNGITLCRFHHPKGRKKEKRLVPFFKELVAVSK